jgi:hypothetical protein
MYVCAYEALGQAGNAGVALSNGGTQATQLGVGRIHGCGEGHGAIARSRRAGLLTHGRQRRARLGAHP